MGRISLGSGKSGYIPAKLGPIGDDKVAVIGAGAVVECDTYV